MRIAVLHSDVAADAPPDELDTLLSAEAIAAALMKRGHVALQVPFTADTGALKTRLADADLVFNLVESVYGRDDLAALAPALLERLDVAYTGSNTAALAVTADKAATKRILRAAGLPTPDWAEAPGWQGLCDDARYIVKSVTADASLGLDDGSVVPGTGVRARAWHSAAIHGGRWFAEAYVEGREFNVAVLEEDGVPCVLPIAEMRFVDWDQHRPTIVGYAAKWNEASEDAMKTVRDFGVEHSEPELNARLHELALDAWHIFSLSGYARVDFRVGVAGRPFILEINANPCLEPGAGFATAAREAGLSYDALVDNIVGAAFRD